MPLELRHGRVTVGYAAHLKPRRQSENYVRVLPFVSGRVSTTRKLITAIAVRYQKNSVDSPAAASALITSGAVPPSSATVTLYQAPMPRAGTSVGNSSLISAGAIDV